MYVVHLFVGWMHYSLTQTVDLKRFSQDYAFRSKLSTEVKCATKNLDLRKFSSEKGQDNIFSIIYHSFLWCLYRVGQKKVSLRSLHITSSNTGRFSKLFHCHVLQVICNKVIIKYSSSPQTCRYTTLWNIYVRKLVNQWNLSHHFVSQNWNITNIRNIPDQCCW